MVTVALLFKFKHAILHENSQNINVLLVRVRS